MRDIYIFGLVMNVVAAGLFLPWFGGGSPALSFERLSCDNTKRIKATLFGGPVLPSQD